MSASLWIAGGTLVVLLCGAVLGAWLYVGKERFRPRRFSRVAEGFYRCGRLHPLLAEPLLRRHRIDLVIDLASGDPPDSAGELAERAAALRLGIERQGFRLYGDGTAKPGVYVAVLQAIARARRARQRVLLHCNAGRERTGAIVAFYRMLFEGWEGERAFEEYLRLRRKHEPRPELVRAVNAHLPELARALVASGDLAAIPDPLPVFRSRTAR